MGQVWKRLARDKLALAGIVVVVVTVLLALLAPWLAPYDPAEQLFDGLTLEGAPLPPNGQLPGSAPTCSAAISSRACSTARAPR